MRPDDFFEEGSPDPVFGLGTRRVKTELLTALRTGPLDGADDIEVAIPLALLIHDNLETYGTSGGQEMSEEHIFSLSPPGMTTIDRCTSSSPRSRSTSFQ